ncbi:MAG: hypothetical protein GY869_25320 [Planctomycetes bacterium]|nr:hypothetical protein [Planctomycetota bacterium]
MPDTISRFGVGLIWFAISTVYVAIAMALHFYNRTLFNITVIPYSYLVLLALVLIGVGFPFYIIGLISVMRAYNKDILCTTGVFRICRHPVYSSWAILVCPGIMLLFKSWIGLAAVALMAITLKFLVRTEDDYLAYKQKIPAILPLGWLKKKHFRRIVVLFLNIWHWKHNGAS